MPGAYCHLTIVNKIINMKTLRSLDLPKQAIGSLMKHTKYCELGAVSPDYPYLRATSSSAKEWADAQHHKIKGYIHANIMHTGINLLRKMTGVKQLRCFAWFCGYISHMVADVTVHPVVNLKVGYYEEGNEAQHRRMEMHQDVYIYDKEYKSYIGMSEQIKHIIGECTAKDTKELHKDINAFWHDLLSSCYPELYQEAPPNIHKWHESFMFLIDLVAEEGEALPLPSRHLESKGLIYPKLSEVDHDNYIKNLDTPSNKKNYDEIFDITVSNVSRVWKIIADAVFLQKDENIDELGIWDFDLGQNVFNNLIMWDKTNETT